jgi:hypothetical protein
MSLRTSTFAFAIAVTDALRTFSSDTVGPVFGYLAQARHLPSDARRPTPDARRPTPDRELIRIVRCGLSDSIAQDLVLDHAEVRVALELLIDRPRKPCISRTTDSQESSSRAVSHTEPPRRQIRERSI